MEIREDENELREQIRALIGILVPWGAPPLSRLSRQGGDFDSSLEITFCDLKIPMPECFLRRGCAIPAASFAARVGIR